MAADAPQRPSSDGAAKIVELRPEAGLDSHEARELALQTLESSGVVYLPWHGFELTARERELLSDDGAMLPTRKERESRVGRPTLVFDPTTRKTERTRIRRPVLRELESMMLRFTDWAERTVHDLLPSYTPALERERVTFRPVPRSRTQGLHSDSSYSHPTEGRGMLRLFTNVDPKNRVRAWQVGETFEPYAKRFLPPVRERTEPIAWLLQHLGILKGRQTPFDRLMADLREVAKNEPEYQASAPRRRVEFPAGASWLAITDLVTHGALEGRNSLDLTFYLPATAMSDPTRSSLQVLERLTGRRLT
jgi:hypothetical protein